MSRHHDIESSTSRLLPHRSSYGFQISRSQLCHLFQLEGIQSGSSLEYLQKRGGPAELAARLLSSPVDGIETITLGQRVEM
jgi:hypothetical protein